MILLKNHLLNEGYNFIKEIDFNTEKQSGKLFEWGAPYGNEDYFYLTAISILLLVTLLPGQKKYTETIKVEAWTIPIFAVDLDGLPVLNLKASDLNLFVNNKRIDNFSFFKKNY